MQQIQVLLFETFLFLNIFHPQLGEPTDTEGPPKPKLNQLNVQI